MLVGNEAYDPAGFVPIATVTATGGESSLSFTSIPQGYASLQIRGLTRLSYATTGNGYVGVRLNSDSGSNYARHELYGNGSNANAYGLASQTQCLYFPVPFDSNTASIRGTVIMDLHDYASTTRNKTLRALAGSDLNGSGDIYLSSGLWANTAAVTTIEIGVGAGWKAGTTFALYGVKAAS